MAFSLLPQRKQYVLVVGDEAVVLSLFSGGRVVDAWVAEPDPETGAAEILTALSLNPSAPVRVLIDAFEQHFREEKVPKVNVLDQGKVVRRHLQVAFPGNNLEGAIPQGQDREGNRFWLFMAVPPTSQVERWLATLEDAGRPPVGVHSLPLESLEMLEALAPGASMGGVRWRMLFSFDMAGGLRQIVSKQGRMVVTRLTPPPAEESSADPVAAVMRDFAQTLTYIKRMGYQRGDQLDVVVLADGVFADHLRTQSWDAHSTTVLSPHEAAARLGIPKATKAGSPYADVLHAGLLATRRKPIMSLRWANAPAVDWRRLIIAKGTLAATLTTLLLIAGAASLGTDALELLDQRAVQEEQLATAQRRLADEVARQKALPYTSTQIREALALDATLSNGDIAPLPVLTGLDQALGVAGVVTTLQIIAPERQAETRGRRRQANAADTYAWRLTASVRFGSEVADDKQAVVMANAVRDRMAAVFPAYGVKMVVPPVAINPDQTLRGGAGLTIGDGTVARTAAYEATYEITAVTGASATSAPADEEEGS